MSLVQDDKGRIPIYLVCSFLTFAAITLILYHVMPALTKTLKSVSSQSIPLPTFQSLNPTDSKYFSSTNSKGNVSLNIYQDGGQGKVILTSDEEIQINFQPSNTFELVESILDRVALDAQALIERIPVTFEIKLYQCQLTAKQNLAVDNYLNVHLLPLLEELRPFTHFEVSLSTFDYAFEGPDSFEFLNDMQQKIPSIPSRFGFNVVMGPDLLGSSDTFSNSSHSSHSSDELSDGNLWQEGWGAVCNVEDVATCLHSVVTQKILNLYKLPSFTVANSIPVTFSDYKAEYSFIAIFLSRHRLKVVKKNLLLLESQFRTNRMSYNLSNNLIECQERAVNAFYGAIDLAPVIPSIELLLIADEALLNVDCALSDPSLSLDHLINIEHLMGVLIPLFFPIMLPFLASSFSLLRSRRTIL